MFLQQLDPFFIAQVICEQNRRDEGDMLRAVFIEIQRTVERIRGKKFKKKNP